MVAVVERDDGLPAGELAGDLDRVLDGLGAGVEQRALLLVVAGRDAVERLGDGDVRLVRRDHEARVGELGDLRLHGRDDAGVRVADGRDGDAGAEVDERVAVGIDDHASPGRDGRDGNRVADAGGDRGGLAGEKLLRTGARQLGDEAALLRERGPAEGGGVQSVVDDAHGRRA